VVSVVEHLLHDGCQSGLLSGSGQGRRRWPVHDGCASRRHVVLLELGGRKMHAMCDYIPSCYAEAM